ncbi:MAG: AraC family transcriptional regulator [Aquaticitalea sp.]
MNLIYNNPVEESTITLTDFSCADGRGLLKQNGLYKILWTMEDVSSIFIDGCSTHLKKNEVLFCTPLNIIELPTKKNGMISLVFNREFYCIYDNDNEVSCNGLLFYGSSNPVIIKIERNEELVFQRLYDTLKEEFYNEDSMQGEMLRSLLVRLLITSNRLLHEEHFDSKLTHSEIDIIRKFNLLVEQHFSTDHKVTEYATMLSKSPKTLANVFTKHSKQTPLSIINERILLEAKRLLLFSEKPINEISKQLGYSYESHFSKFFKDHKGFTPLKFRKEFLNKL